MTKQKRKKKSPKEIGLKPLFIEGKWSGFEFIPESKRQQKRFSKTLNQRMKYGFGDADTWSLDNALGHLIANALFLFVYQARNVVMDTKDCQKDGKGGGLDYDLILKHAKAFREIADADPWDTLSEGDERSKRFDFRYKQEAFEEAMWWLMKNWHGLWW